MILSQQRESGGVGGVGRDQQDDDKTGCVGVEVLAAERASSREVSLVDQSKQVCLAQVGVLRQGVSHLAVDHHSHRGGGRSRVQLFSGCVSCVQQQTTHLRCVWVVFSLLFVRANHRFECVGAGAVAVVEHTQQCEVRVLSSALCATVGYKRGCFSGVFCPHTSGRTVNLCIYRLHKRVLARFLVFIALCRLDHRLHRPPVSPVLCVQPHIRELLRHSTEHRVGVGVDLSNFDIHVCSSKVSSAFSESRRVRLAVPAPRSVHLQQHILVGFQEVVYSGISQHSDVLLVLLIPFLGFRRSGVHFGANCVQQPVPVIRVGVGFLAIDVKEQSGETFNACFSGEF
mmetsp:Transcript_50554/g.99031  ORF Transcript_50554/g.99031 Transcript_50554/m.99031 type:complete len:342 (-) Transcript_50554:678-1703(-)